MMVWKTVVTMCMVIVWAWADVHLSASAQTPPSSAAGLKERMDSLQNVFRKANTDSARVTALNNISRAYWSNNIVQARVYADSALHIAERSGFTRGRAEALNTIGVLYYYQGWYDIATGYYLQSLALREAIGDKRGMANSYNNLGLIYNVQEQYDKALEYLKRARQAYSDINSTNSVALANNNIGLIFRKRRQFDSAMAVHNTALVLLKDGTNKLGVALTYTNIGAVYAEQQRHKEALEYQRKALAAYDYGGDRKGVANCYQQIARSCLELKLYDQALYNAERALHEAETISMRLEIRDAYRLFSRIHEAMGNYQAALSFHQRFAALNDTMLSEATRQKTAELNTKFEADKKAQTITLLERDKQRQTLQRNALVAVVVLVVIVALLLYGRYKLKHQSEERLQRQNALIEAEREQSERLLLNVLPASIAARLKSGSQVIADRFDAATVLFADIGNFTTLSQQLSPEQLVEFLDAVFSDFDAVATHFGLEKIKTIGDCYMLVGGVPEPQEQHAERVALAALEMMNVIQRLKTTMGFDVQLRIGMHTGVVVAGVIGKNKFSYDLWGDTVNLASRMESQGVSGNIHCSQEIYAALHEQFVFEERGVVDIKGKGLLKTYFLKAVRSQNNP